jgi:hypothetical protein
MEEILRFWVDCEFEAQRGDVSGQPKSQVIADILRQYEEQGHAMRHLDFNGQIAWKATPLMLSVLADLERDAVDGVSLSSGPPVGRCRQIEVQLMRR